MPPFLRLAILPLIGCGLILGSALWGQRELKLRFLGKSADGELIGMVAQREKSSDILASIDTKLVITLANGEVFKANYIDYDLISFSNVTKNNTLGEQVVSSGLETETNFKTPTPQEEPLFEELKIIFDEVASGNTESVRWALLREGRRVPDPKRVVRVERTEIIIGYIDVPKVPQVFGIKDGTLLLDKDETTSPYAGQISIHGVFDVTDAKLIESQKGDSLIDYSYKRNGVEITPAKKDFFLYAEPYSTQFRPIFAFEANGISVARLSHIGRHGGPTLALRLYEPCRVYYDEKHPEEAVVTAIAGPIGKDPLGWFSRFCEGLFGQWGSTALITIAGLLFLTSGLIFISLAIFPSRKIIIQDKDGSPQRCPAQ